MTTLIMRNLFLCFITIACLITPFNAELEAQNQLTLNDANVILKSAQTYAKEIGVNVSFSVVDARGDLIALIRMDGARFFTTEVAIGKAMVSAILGQPSGLFANQNNSSFFQRLNEANQNKLYFIQGAVPIILNGTTIGAIGVSGASSQQDEDISKVGAKTLIR